MPYADVMSVAARSGKAYVCIDEKGNVTASIHPRSNWRKLTPVLGLAVKYYKVAPQTTIVNGKEYDSKELEEALSALSPVEKPTY